MTTLSEFAASEFEVVQEDDVVASRKVLAIMGLGVLVTIAAVAISGWILTAMVGRKAERPQAQSPIARRQIAGIHQTPIERDRHGWELREQQRRSLDEYRWVDRQRGIAQIPIDRAMQMVADEAAKERGTR